ncbi:MAG TPA: HNH endonuclease [Gammaproteobacteria bacterium]|nr:HNH endonuclease [Gammaproteobacteria bacterium]
MPINHEQRAYFAWPILIKCAKNHRTIQYGALAKKLDIHWRPVRHILDVIQNYCFNEKLPPLTILVVNKGRGIPGKGFIAWDMDDLNADLKKVFSFDWYLLPNPFGFAAGGDTRNTLAKKLVKNPQTAADIYAQIKVRGYAQLIFRNALLLAYEAHCAFCGMTFEEALEAAHIIPWNDANNAQRLSPTNGLLLCSTHHELFDAGLMTMDRKNKVRYYDPNAKDGKYTKTDKELTIKLHGKSAFMPKKQKYWPSNESFNYLETKAGWKDLS